MPTHDALASAFIWWSLPFVLTTIVSGGSTMAALEERSGSYADIVLFVLTCTAWVRPSGTLMLLAHVGSTAIKLSEMPRVWDGTWWFIFLSLPAIYVLMCRRVATPKERDAAFAEMATALRSMCHVLYAGASLLKINRDFFNVEYSCAPIFGAQLLTRLPAAWGIDDSPLAMWVTRGFPLLTVAVELGIPVLSLLVGPAAAMTLGLGLHFGIAITPSPNNAGSFSVTAALYYLGLLPDEMARATGELTAVLRAPRGGLPRWVVATVACAAAAYGSGLTTCDAAGFVYVVQCGVCARAIYLARVASSGAAVEAPRARSLGGATALGLTVTLYYAFGAAALGTWDMGIDHPYSNVRLHAPPTNHYFLPLGLLHRAPLFAEAWPPRLPWSGGAVLVEHSTSEYFLTQGGVPGEVDDLTERAVAMLVRAGHRGRQFFSVAKRFSPWSPRNAGDALRPEAFVPFTVPAFEVRRLISEDTLGADARLAYSRDVGKPAAQRTTVHVATDASGAIASCEVHDPAYKARGMAFWVRPASCAADELALLPPVPAWLLTVLPIWNAYPLLDGDDSTGLICYG